MDDTIDIVNLRVRTIIGANDDERREKQDVVISLRLTTDARRPAVTDNLRDALNYRSVSKRVLQLAETSQFFLIERLAEEIARLCIREFRLSRVQVRVEKPGAIRFADTVSVCIERGADDFSSTGGIQP